MKKSRLPLIFFAIGGCLANAYLLLGIFKSTNSTASIGFLFIPIYFVGGGALSLLPYFTWKCWFDYHLNKSLVNLIKTIALSAICIYIGYSVGIKAWTLHQLKSPDVNSDRLLKIGQNYSSYGQEDVLLAILSHPNCSSEVLLDFWSKRELLPESVISQVISHQRVPPSILEQVAQMDVNYSLYGAAVDNPNLPPQVMQQIAEKATAFDGSNKQLVHTYVLAPLVRRTDLPQEILEKIYLTKSPEYFLVYALAQSSRLTCEQKRALLNQTSDPLAHREIDAGLRKSDCP